MAIKDNFFFWRTQPLFHFHHLETEITCFEAEARNDKIKIIADIERILLILILTKLIDFERSQATN